MRVERGRLSAIFDPSFAFLREIALDGEELFRGVGFVARDANWGTPALRGEATVADGADALVVESAGELTAGDLQWRLRWTVSATAVEVEGQWSSRSGFTTNRTGFVVLHSLGAARGRPVEIDHPDGAREASTFPTLVSPHQPFFDIAAMRYESAAGADIRLRFDGEIFETEDQRNWTDASYKTYCRPLRLPYPYGIEPGAQVRQGLRIDLRPSPRRPATRDESDPIVGPPIDAPLLGSSLPPGTPAVGVAQALKRLALDFTALARRFPASAGVRAWASRFAARATTRSTPFARFGRGCASAPARRLSLPNSTGCGRRPPARTILPSPPRRPCTATATTPSARRPRRSRT